MVGRGPGILSTLPGSESVGTSPAPYRPGYVGPDLTLPTTHLDSGTPPHSGQVYQLPGPWRRWVSFLVQCPGNR